MKDIVIRKRVGLKNCKVVFSLCPHNLAWIENNLPSLNGNKAIDNRSVHIRDGMIAVRY
jgi:NAD-dependent dihydropyrimidine dehydrogenase PreA subunit